MQENPLLLAVLEILRQSDAAVSEHQLIRTLSLDGGHFAALANSPDLALFQKHFLVMNALYQLQQQLLVENIHLHISPLAIYMQPMEVAQGELLAGTDNDVHLRRYYLDWKNFRQASASSVSDLLDQFWQMYARHEDRADAYRVLDLPLKAPWPEVQQNYRKLAAQHHPDRGGDAVRFIAIRRAYEKLRQLP